jgi:hypothetical protein
MLHHRRKLDREGARELTDGHTAFLFETSKNSPPRWVDEGRESAV